MLTASPARPPPQYGPDDYVAVALSLYLDIINLFLYLLQLLQAISGDRN